METTLTQQEAWAILNKSIEFAKQRSVNSVSYLQGCTVGFSSGYEMMYLQAKPLLTALDELIRCTRVPTSLSEKANALNRAIIESENFKKLIK